MSLQNTSNDKMREKVARAIRESRRARMATIINADVETIPLTIGELADADAALAAIGITDETGDVQWLQHLLKWREHQMEISRKFWIRAGKAALNGDTRDLRNRIDLAEAPPMTVVLSAPPAAAQEGE